MKYIVFVAFYFYAIAIVFGTGYIVFYKVESGWWFLLTALLLNITPQFSDNSKVDKITD